MTITSPAEALAVPVVAIKECCLSRYAKSISPRNASILLRAAALVYKKLSGAYHGDNLFHEGGDSDSDSDDHSDDNSEEDDDNLEEDDTAANVKAMVRASTLNCFFLSRFLFRLAFLLSRIFRRRA